MTEAAETVHVRPGMTLAVAEPYSADKHYAALCEWSLGHGWPLQPKAWVAPAGWVVPGVAMVLLARREGTPVWILEEFIVNPKAPRTMRNAALDLVIATALADVQAAGGELVVGYTDNPHVLRRAHRLGFALGRCRWTVGKRLK